MKMITMAQKAESRMPVTDAETIADALRAGPASGGLRTLSTKNDVGRMV